MDTKIKGITLILAGDKYVIPPLTLGALEDVQERLASYDGSLSKESIATVIDVTLLAVRRNYPDMTRESLRGIIDLENMADVMNAVMDVSGLRRKEIESGELAALASASTGQRSTPPSSVLPAGDGMQSENSISLDLTL